MASHSLYREISRPVVTYVVTPQGLFLIPLELRFQTRDPIAVRLHFLPASAQPVVWHIARDLLALGTLVDNAAPGDFVTVLPRPNLIIAGAAVIELRLTSPSGTGRYYLVADQVTNFLSATFEAAAPCDNELVEIAVESLVLEMEALYHRGWHRRSP